MNMPSAQGYAVHQITVDHPGNSLDEVREAFNDEEFVLCRLMYRRMNNDGEMCWLDKGDLVINTNHVGKIQEYIFNERDSINDQPFGHSDASGSHLGGQAPPVRKRRGYI
jgi:hypothetical protein